MKDWNHRASCRYYDATLWDVEKLFGPGAEKRMQEREAKAKAICSTCPVRWECAEYGIENVIEFDAIEQIYGGFTPGELAEMVGSEKKHVSGVLTFRDAKLKEAAL